MARKNNNGIDKARQAIGKAFLSSVKSSKKAVSKSAKRARKGVAKKLSSIQRQRESDIVARWRALKNLGLINTKNNPSKKHLTTRLKNKINKEFFDFQGEGKYVKGKTIRPLEREVIKTKRGERIKYTLDDHFKFMRTKKKTDVKTGVIKTSKGYIIQKKTPESKVTINDKGEIIEHTGKERIRRKSYKGEKILELYSQIKEKRIRMANEELLAIKKWNSENNIEMFERDTLDEFTALIDRYAREMPHRIFEDFLDVSEVQFIRG